MFYNYNEKDIRLYGRWDKSGEKAITTAVGSSVEFYYKGKDVVLCFDVTEDKEPLSHIWISVDDNGKIETTVGKYIRLSAKENGVHFVKVIYKCQVQEWQRWHIPLAQKLTFEGIYADALCEYKEDNKKTVEFVGDSITEGIQVDAEFGENKPDDRVYTNDVCGTYAYVTAENLELRPIFMAYGRLGVTREAKGGVPPAPLAYPYNFAGSPITHKCADYIVVNYGPNDRWASPEGFQEGYYKLLLEIRKYNKSSQIFALSAFCGVHTENVEKAVEKFNCEKNDCVVFINSTGWIEEEPLHPPRESHLVVADKLSGILGEYIEGEKKE